jgi:hypothetical protein
VFGKAQIHASPGAESEPIGGTRTAEAAERTMRSANEDLGKRSYAAGSAVGKARATQVGVSVKVTPF